MNISIKDIVDYVRKEKNTYEYPMYYYDKRKGELLTIDFGFDFETSFEHAESEEERNQLSKYNEHELLIERNPDLYVEVPDFDNRIEDNEIELLFNRIEDKDKLDLVKSYYDKEGMTDISNFRSFLKKQLLSKVYKEILLEVYAKKLIKWSVLNGLDKVIIPDEYSAMASFKGTMLNKCSLIKTEIAGDIPKYKFLVIDDETKKYEVIEDIFEHSSLIFSCSGYVTNRLFDNVYFGLIKEGYSQF